MWSYQLFRLSSPYPDGSPHGLDHDHMANKSAEVVAVAVLFLLLAWIAVGLRTYCRTILVRSVGNDDKIMIVLLVRI